jgi:hypothetical protein
MRKLVQVWKEKFRLPGDPAIRASWLGSGASPLPRSLGWFIPVRSGNLAVPPSSIVLLDGLASPDPSRECRDSG